MRLQGHTGMVKGIDFARICKFIEGIFVRGIGITG